MGSEPGGGAGGKLGKKGEQMVLRASKEKGKELQQGGT